MNKKIIGFHGPAFSGKDTAALTIKESDNNTEIFAIVKPLKDACKILFNFTDEQLYDPILKETIDERWGKSPRQIMQWLGTDVLRNQFDQDFFLKNLQQRINLSDSEYNIISDVRFDNEAEFIRSLEGKVVKIERKNAETTKHSDHASEKGISSHLVDAIIKNDSTLQEFKTNVILAIRFLFGKLTNSV